MTAKNPNYDVGYAKPPKHSRFQPGQSGNSKGRPKGTRNLSSDLKDELGERIRVREGDQEKSISKQRALVKALVAKALKGDTRAATVLITMVDKYIVPELAATDTRPLSRTEEQILEDFLRQHAGRAGTEEGDRS
jgi:hypothetical protein